MSKKFLDSVQKLDHLICHEKTGSVKDLATKMRLSPRSVYNYIALMKSKGAPIYYSRTKRSFLYRENGNFCFGFLRPEEDNFQQN